MDIAEFLLMLLLRLLLLWALCLSALFLVFGEEIWRGGAGSY